MHVPEIIEVKDHLEKLKTENNLVSEWELPYENILTRRSAAIYFFTPVDDSKLEEIEKELSTYPGFDYRENSEKNLSKMKYRVTFDKGFVLGRGYIGVEEAEKDHNYQRI